MSSFFDTASPLYSLCLQSACYEAREKFNKELMLNKWNFVAIWDFDAFMISYRPTATTMLQQRALKLTLEKVDNYNEILGISSDCTLALEDIAVYPMLRLAPCSFSY